MAEAASNVEKVKVPLSACCEVTDEHHVHTHFETPYVLSVDIGTTVIRCHIYDKNINIKGASSKRIELLHPQQGYVEMDPDTLWQQFQDVVNGAIRAAGLEAEKITCMGIATQRNTLITWDKDTGKPFHNFITWQDTRAGDYVKAWNASYTLRGFNKGAGFMHGVTRNKRYLAASVLKFTVAQCGMRLLWLLDNNIEMRQRANEGKLLYGCLETWLLWKLTNGAVFATDYSCASATALYDTFQLEWSTFVFNLLNIPMNIVPIVMDTSGHFGDCQPDLFGAPIPITAIVADQQSSMFAECCFNVGDVKLTMGTATYMDMNTGSKPHASIAGVYPLIGWKTKEEIVFLAEGCAGDTGTAIEWVKSIGVFSDPSETAKMAESVPDSGGVYFVPAFSGLQAPINDEKACTTMVGMTPATTKAHIVRALLESVAFKVKLLYEAMVEETKLPTNLIRVDGGVSNNSFVVQLISDIVNQPLDRAKDVDMTSLGAAFLAGLAVGVWTSKEEFRSLRASSKVFQPRANWTKYKPVISEWERAVKRSMQWYKNK